MLAMTTGMTAALMALSVAQAPAARWTEEKANAWYAAHPWLTGCNFSPSNAINQLEMWQADTFDPDTIDRELGYAQSLGFTSVRVFLHDLLWQQDAEGFCTRIDQFLAIADKHGIGVMFVPFDSVWDPYPKLGKQRDPKPHVHNSGWVQSPSLDVLKDPAKVDALEGYVKGLLSRYAADKRVHAWDLYNEPANMNGNSYGKLEPKNKPELGLALLQKAFQWAREVNPSQPLTAGVWMGDWSKPDKLAPTTKFMLDNSDVITFHCYGPLDEMKSRVEPLKRYKRPILCTEYMVRSTGCTFQNILPYFKEQHIAAYNWGLVAGKTQTNYPWESWEKTLTAEPELWFHEIFRKDGTPYREDEVATIRKLTGAGKK
jgi:hypothetical protein